MTCAVYRLLGTESSSQMRLTPCKCAIAQPTATPDFAAVDSALANYMCAYAHTRSFAIRAT
jgi:hypothetical protein